MKFKKFISLALLLGTAALAFGACNEQTPDQGQQNDSETGGGGNSLSSYVLEAEYVDLEDAIGAGYSSDQRGLGMIYGQGTQAEIDKGWSSGYYLGYTYTPEFTIDFVFTADKAATATLVLRLGSELGNLSLTPDIFEVKLNGTSIDYGDMYIAGGVQNDMENVKFYDKTVTATAELKEGENIVTLSVLANSIMGSRSGGPLIDCLKISTAAKLAYTELKDNPSRRGEI